MSTQSRVTTIDYEKLTEAEKQYVSVYGLEALDRALKAGRGPTQSRAAQQQAETQLNLVGKPQPDMEGYKIVSGKARYTSDIYLPDMLYVRVRRSPLPHAMVKNIDISQAAQLPGVHLVMTSKDIPEKMTAGGRPILACHERDHR
jgi:hypothetical protein